MDKKIKAKWLKALRSGRYRQGRNNLLDEGKFCCLGVLARIQGCPLELLHEPDDSSSPPKGFNAGLRRNQKTILVNMNDGAEHLGVPVRPHSFKQIADYIEKNL